MIDRASDPALPDRSLSASDEQPDALDALMRVMS